ncbi:MAG: hypothetical protein IT261_05140 [Saprospiraceae bacterium]|nr:hypothetical protein [Saprospiraceae bacterium]
MLFVRVELPDCQGNQNQQRNPKKGTVFQNKFLRKDSKPHRQKAHSTPFSFITLPLLFMFDRFAVGYGQLQGRATTRVAPTGIIQTSAAKPIKPLKPFDYPQIRGLNYAFIPCPGARRLRGNPRRSLALPERLPFFFWLLFFLGKQKEK